MGKSTISMVIFNSYVKLPEGIFPTKDISYIYHKRDVVTFPNFANEHVGTKGGTTL